MRRSCRGALGWRFVPLLTLLPLLGKASPAGAQSTLDRPPNFGGTWTGAPGTLHFNFLHRFNVGREPLRKVENGPTFLLGASLPANLLVGARYATNSQVSVGFPNEWEFFGRFNPVAEERGAPLDAAIHAGYNQAAESFDAELALAKRIGRLRLLANGRWFSAAFDGDSARLALGVGATVRLNDTFALAGDWATLVDADSTEDAAWGAALQIAIPYTPHTLSLQVTNTNTATLQGSTVDAGVTRYGFEFTIPFTLSRYFGSRDRAAAAPAPPTVMTGDTVRVVIRNLAYQIPNIQVSPGTTVVWINEDAVPHTVTSEQGVFGSELMNQGQTYTRTFDQAGTFPYYCTPHPFMKGTVVVR